MKLRWFGISAIFLFSLMALFYACREPAGNSTGTRVSKTSEQDTLTYLNHADSARYVGIATCRLCHQDIYNTFIKTGMGKSFDLATKAKSAANFKHAAIYDRIGDFHYKAYWDKEQLMFLEYRLEGKDTIYKRREKVDYIIGSGQHTNSHLQSVNGYINQMPMTFYTQKGEWDLPPGFENGHNTRFQRKIGLECMSCHNAYPDFVMGSENKYNSVPEGINCERCHGPGSIHVAQRSTGSKVDTSRLIDYSIVNPGKLAVDLQFDICQRCHLQGNAILKEGKSFYDFRPGKKLSDFMTVFLPKYQHADDEFIMASHADRLKQSQCFIKSYSADHSKQALRPYKEALTCVTCHNPHVSVRETNKSVFNDACNNCHGKKLEMICSESKAKRMKVSDNCVSCHMPSSGSIDIPHVTVHDHYIRKPITQKEKEGLKTFIGLYAINEKNPDAMTKAKAYVNQYDKFELKPAFLDSALRYLPDAGPAELERNFKVLVHLYFMRQDYGKILSYVQRLKADYLLQQKLVHKSYDNEDAWACYHVGEAYANTGQTDAAIPWFEKAVELAAFNPEFRNKLGTTYAAAGQLKMAEQALEAALQENPKLVSAMSNLGYVRLMQGDAGMAENLYQKALQLDPDYEPLLLNVAGLYLYKNNFKKAEEILLRIVKRNPANEKAKAILQQIRQRV